LRETSRKTGRVSYCFETRRHSIAVGCMVRAVVGNAGAAACDGVPEATPYAAPIADATWKGCGAVGDPMFQARKESPVVVAAGQAENRTG
jgi:hypothetical protein